MYIYGGGWNDEDTAAGVEARTIGESTTWRRFFNTQGAHYDFKTFLHCSCLGLDCTGYIGWALYNLFNTKSGHNGYVFESRILGYRLQDMGLGKVTDAARVTSHRCGDIFFSPLYRHAYISLGECSDKSVVLLHSSPPGVMLSGTSSPYGSYSLATKYATRFMRKNYPQWSLKFPCCNRGKEYLANYHRLRFSASVVADPENFFLKNPHQILSEISNC